MSKRMLLLMSVGGCGILFGCGPTVKVKPIQVEPIHITLEVNVRVDRELDQFFDFEEEINPDTGAEKPEVSL